MDRRADVAHRSAKPVHQASLASVASWETLVAGLVVAVVEAGEMHRLVAEAALEPLVPWVAMREHLP